MKYSTLITVALISCADILTSSETTTVSEEINAQPTWYPKEATSSADTDAINKARENAYLEYMSQPENTQKPKTVIVGAGRGSVLGTPGSYSKEHYGEKAQDLLLIDLDKKAVPDIYSDVRNISKLAHNTYDDVIFEHLPLRYVYTDKAIDGAINILKSDGKLILLHPRVRS